MWRNIIKTFTDDDGNKYELLPMTSSQPGYILKPIQPKAVEKLYTIRYDTAKWNEKEGREIIETIRATEYMTKPQAEALAAAIEALVEYVQYPFSGSTVAGPTHMQIHKFTEARKAMQEDQNDN